MATNLYFCDNAKANPRVAVFNSFNYDRLEKQLSIRTARFLCYLYSTSVKSLLFLYVVQSKPNAILEDII